MDAPFLFVDEVDTAGKRCLVRLDLNVPLAEGRVTDDTRIRRVLPGLRALQNTGARIVILTHLGRPKGKPVDELSVRPVAAALAALMNCDVPVEDDLLGEIGQSAFAALADGDVLMMENLRFHVVKRAMIVILQRRLQSLVMCMSVMRFPARIAHMPRLRHCRD